MSEIIAISNQKGGVGKTATAYNLAYCLAKVGKNTLLIDLDPQANASEALFHVPKTWEGISARDIFIKGHSIKDAIYRSYISGDYIDNLNIIPSRIDLATIERELKRFRKEEILKKQIKSLNNLYDYILIDCPSNLGDLTINAMNASDIILTPITYHSDASKGLHDLLIILDEIKEDDPYKHLILQNGYDARKETMIGFMEKRLINYTNIGAVMSTIIRQDEEINKAKAYDLPINLYAPKSRGALDFLALTREIISYA